MTVVYESIRRDIIDAVRAEMMGPGSEPTPWSCGTNDAEFEIISESPFQRYSVGILYEQKTRRDPEDESIEERDIDGRADVDELLDVATTTANQYYPSSIGMSFYVSGRNPALVVSISAGRYRRLDWSESLARVNDLPAGVSNSALFAQYLSLDNGNLSLRQRITKDIRDELLKLEEQSHEWKDVVHRLFNLQNNGWKRIPLDNDPIQIVIPHVDTDKPTREPYEVCDGLKLVCVRRPNSQANSTLFTLALINDFEGGERKSVDRAFFQVGFSVKTMDSDVRFLDYESLQGIYASDLEALSMNLLYRNCEVFGVGHGCAVSWDEKGTVLRTEIIPTYEVPSSKFDVDELSSLVEIMSMRNLSDLTPLSKTEIISGLNAFVSTYREWVDRKRDTADTLDEHLQSIAQRHLAACYECADRLTRGVRLLKNDDHVFHAFQLANRAMLMQRAHSLLQRAKRYPEEDDVKWPDYREFPLEGASWRPFQLAFLLLNLESVGNSKSQERSIVDLIWFPTGGGKTEAYLGVSAFTIFLRRLRYPTDGAGTAIIMRYTLRLLTAQQFQRASTLICACELIRQEKPMLLGESSITIGLWIGGSSTPNRLDDARDRLDKLVSGVESDNPFQVLTCPWCGTRLTVDKNRGSWGYRIGSRPRRLIIFCTERSCPFRNGLPIEVVDEDIYRNPPTLLFGTVDKFALLPWRREVKNIFGLSSGNLSPELIIQDELHLISGPLGTMVGLYETAVDLLCSAKGVSPKIIASTATIRRANDQVKALYNRDVSVFPPAGIEAEDSFFARVADSSEKSGRMYVGLMATGKTLTTTQVRLMAGLLQCIFETEYDSEVKDPYWTLVCYFNTIRELGRTSTLALDDIKDQIRRIAFRRGTKRRLYYEADELTGSRKSEDIPTMLERLHIAYPDRHAIDILLASSMISVGIDIDRLGLMMVVSQPKSTSEYIQSTSRVGRMHPGLIFTLYDGARPRDRSHYERFTAYHQAFYRYVEPTSVTPFSGPARDRALHAVLVSLVRHLIDDLASDNQAGDFRADHHGIKQIIDAVTERAKSVMPEEVESTATELAFRVSEWSNIAETYKPLTYSNHMKRNHLLYPATRDKGRFWRTMHSMRNVDAPGNIKVLDENWGVESDQEME